MRVHIILRKPKGVPTGIPGSIEVVSTDKTWIENELQRLINPGEFVPPSYQTWEETPTELSYSQFCEAAQEIHKNRSNHGYYMENYNAITDPNSHLAKSYHNLEVTALF